MLARVSRLEKTMRRWNEESGAKEIRERRQLNLISGYITNNKTLKHEALHQEINTQIDKLFVALRRSNIELSIDLMKSVVLPTQSLFMEHNLFLRGVENGNHSQSKQTSLLEGLIQIRVILEREKNGQLALDINNVISLYQKWFDTMRLAVIASTLTKTDPLLLTENGPLDCATFNGFFIVLQFGSKIAL